MMMDRSPEPPQRVADSLRRCATLTAAMSAIAAEVSAIDVRIQIIRARHALLASSLYGLAARLDRIQREMPLSEPRV